MPGIVARLIVALVVMLAAPVVFFIVMILLYGIWGYGDSESIFIVASFITISATVVAWIGVWFRSVNWSSTRVVLAAALLVVALVGASVCCWALGELISEIEVGIVGGSMVWAIAWFGLTPLIWRETGTERAERLRSFGVRTIACPSCGYNLTGLREARCPECGAHYTIDELFGSVVEQREQLGSL